VSVEPRQSLDDPRTKDTMIATEFQAIW